MHNLTSILMLMQTHLHKRAISLVLYLFLKLLILGIVYEIYQLLP